MTSVDFSSPTLTMTSRPAPSAPDQAGPGATRSLPVAIGKPQAEGAAAGKPAVQETAAPQPRIVSFSDATTGILIEATQNPYTGGLIDQFPNRALIESYGKQILLQEGPITPASAG